MNITLEEIRSFPNDMDLGRYVRAKYFNEPGITVDVEYEDLFIIENTDITDGPKVWESDVTK